MDLYIDKENVHSLIENRNNDLYSVCLMTMQKQLNVYFNFNKEELQKNEGLMAWFKLFAAGVGRDSKHIFNENIFPLRPLMANTYTTFDKEHLSSIYLINDDHIQFLKDKGVVIIGSPGEEIEVFNLIFFFQSDYSFERKFRIGGSEFIQWEALSAYSTSISDILLIDPYVLSDKDLIDFNLIPYLKVLATKARCELNIVLYVNHKSVKIEFEDLSSKIQKEIKAVTGNKPNLTLIKVEKDMASYAEHDRTILTNYFRIYSGDSFNYFNSDGAKRTKGRELQYSSFGKRENHRFALELISDIQNNLYHLPPNAVEGDKKSNFLCFK